MTHIKYCVKCGNTGLDIDNNPCDCQFQAQTFYDAVTCMDIPEQYRGVNFNKFLVPKDIHESYAEYLDKLHTDVSQMRMKYRNICLCSPIGHSKTILAYSAIQNLFRYGIPTFPVYDILEIKRIMLDSDLCRKQFYEVSNPEYLITSPYVFVKIPRVTTWEVYDTIATILDRRVRRGHCTIFIYDGTWEQLIKGDRQDVLVNLIGDGNYNTLEVKSWYVDTTKTLMDAPVETNIG